MMDQLSGELPIATVDEVSNGVSRVGVIRGARYGVPDRLLLSKTRNLIIIAATTLLLRFLVIAVHYR